MKLPSIELIMIAARAAVLLLALFTLAWAFIKWRRDTNRDTQRVFEQLDLVRAELLQLQDQIISQPIAARAAQIHYEAPVQRPVPSIVNTSPKPKLNAMTNAAPRGYEVATRLARNGASCDELMSTCALSRHEAELLVRLHAGMKSQQPPSSTASGSSNGKPAPHSNLNQLKNIGNAKNGSSQPKVSIKQDSPAPIRSATVKPAYQSRVSLVG